MPHLAAVAGGDGVVSAPGEVPAHGALGQAQVQHGVGVVGEHGRGYVNCRALTVLSWQGLLNTIYQAPLCQTRFGQMGNHLLVFSTPPFVRGSEPWRSRSTADWALGTMQVCDSRVVRCLIYTTISSIVTHHGAGRGVTIQKKIEIPNIDIYFYLHPGCW